MDNGLWCSKAIHERKSLIMTLPQLKHKLRCVSAWREIRSQLLKSIGGLSFLSTFTFHYYSGAFHVQV